MHFMKSVIDHSAQNENRNSISVKSIDYIELYVGNALQAAHFFRTAFGFRPIAYTGLETGERDRVSFIMEQGEIRLILTAAALPDSPVAEHVRLHGDGVKDIALAVDDVSRAFGLAVKRGATPVLSPTVFEGQDNRLVKATIAACGNLAHSFTQRTGTRNSCSAPYRPLAKAPPAFPTGLKAIDHIAVNVERGALDRWVDFYRDVLDFRLSHQEDVFTENSAMNSKVVQNFDGRVKFPIIEPAEGRRKSQIEEYLEFNRGPGAQHIAFLSDNIVETVRQLRENNIEFLLSPDAYYQMLKPRVGEIEVDLESLRSLSILADRDPWGYLLQIFSKPLQSRPTLFVEIIQRVGARGFGGGNIRALFEAVEREQSLRGNL
jgi:4-hydroxyphenylpyruvate dioxygenase